jgi:hypothetical protein
MQPPRPSRAKLTLPDGKGGFVEANLDEVRVRLQTMATICAALGLAVPPAALQGDLAHCPPDIMQQMQAGIMIAGEIRKAVLRAVNGQAEVLGGRFGMGFRTVPKLATTVGGPPTENQLVVIDERQHAYRLDVRVSLVALPAEQQSRSSPESPD